MVVNMKATGLLPSIYGLLLRWTLISLLFKKKKKKFFGINKAPDIPGQ